MLNLFVLLDFSVELMVAISLVVAIDWHETVVALQSDSLNDKSFGSLWIHQKAFLCVISCIYMKLYVVSKPCLYTYT